MLKNVSEERFDSAVNFYCDTLGIDVESVEFEFSALRQSDRAWGLTYNAVDVIIVELDNSLSAKNTLKTLAHELVHARQFLAGDLDIQGEYWLWKGEPVFEDYENEPHEIEANALESMLYSSFIEWESKK